MFNNNFYINKNIPILTTESLKTLTSDIYPASFLEKDNWLYPESLSFLENKPTVKYSSTKVLELGSCAFRQWKAKHSHCQYIHGYQLKAKFWFEASTLDDKNWIVDFGNLKTLEQTLKAQFDHTLCIAKDDPLLTLFECLAHKGGCDLRVMDSVGIEKTAEWCLDAAAKFLKTYKGNRAWVTKVEVWEHERNSATAEYNNPTLQILNTI